MTNLCKTMTSLISLSLVINANATFSIIAVDTETKEFGSALASCVITDELTSQKTVESLIDQNVVAYVPEKGIMNMQSTISTHKIRLKAQSLMSKDLGADDIITNLIEHEKNIWKQEGGEKLWEQKQYLALTLKPKTLETTKSVYSGALVPIHFAGSLKKTFDSRYSYVIAGNELTDESVLNSMDEGFKNKEGSLTEKLMAALKNVRNEKDKGDARCTKSGITANFAFIRTYKNNVLINKYSVYIHHSKNKDGIDRLLKEVNYNHNNSTIYEDR